MASFKGLSDVVVSVSLNGSIVDANEAACREFGWAREELIGSPIEMLVPLAKRDAHKQYRHEFAKAPVHRLKTTDLNIKGRRKDGSEFACEIELCPMSDGKLVLAFIHNIEQRIVAEKSMVRLHTALRNLEGMNGDFK